MRAKPIQFVIVILLAATAWGQTAGQSASQVFHFTSAQSMVAIQEITNAVRTVGGITQATLDIDAKALTVSATTSQIAAAAWLFAALDQPAPANLATQEYRPAGATNDVVQILYLTHPQTMQNFQEIVNTVRTIPEMAKVFPYSGQFALAIRGTDSQVAMTDWLFHQVDQPAGMQPATVGMQDYTSPGATNDLVRTVRFTHAQSPQSFQEVVNAMRTIPRLTHVFPCTGTATVALRGPNATVALATWLFQQLDQPAGGQTAPASPPEFRMPGGADDVTQVFYLPAATSAQSLQSVVSALRGTGNIPSVFPNSTQKAVIVRGAATQIAAADLLIKQMEP